MKAPGLLKRLWISLLSAFLTLASIDASLATTVIPFVNVGEMALFSDAVVLAKVQNVYAYQNGREIHDRTRLLVERSIKGNLSPNSSFELQSESGFQDELYFEASGDMRYEAGRSYLLFLRKKEGSPHWEPILMAYGIFEKIALDKKEYLVPTAEGRSLGQYPRPDGQVVEPLRAYEMEDLLFLLRETLINSKNWNGEAFGLPPDLNQRLLDITAAPGHCNFFSARWLGFPDTPLPIYAEDDGDPTIADYSQRVSAAVSLLNSNYTDLNLTYGGTTNYTPNCSGGGGNAYSAGSGFFSALPGDRWILVMFDDPCDQITDLNIVETETTFSCAGVLARGGLWGFSPGHVYDGMNKNDAAYGYVVVNERAGDCLLNSTIDYEYLIAHEITHGLGFDHISESAGVANMNPVCCNDITALDLQCAEYYYGDAAFPVEWLQFKVEQEESGIALTWETAWEVNNRHFVVERSTDGLRFQPVGRVAAAGTADYVQSYRFVDEEPASGVNYYRLRQVDFDGAASYSEVRSAFWAGSDFAIAFTPNPHAGGALTVETSVPQAGDLELSLYNAGGQLLRRLVQPVQQGANRLEIDAESLPAGIYLVRAVWEGASVSERLIIR